MIKSMTAYGRGSTDSVEGRWVVEVHSVNRKTLETHIYLPREFLVFDMMLRKWLAPFVQRGQVTIRVTLQREEAAAIVAALAPKLKTLQTSWTELAKELGYDPKSQIDLKFLLERMATAPEKIDEAKLEAGLKAAFEDSVKEWQSMREREGKALVEDIALHLQRMEVLLAEIEKLAPKAAEEFRQKITTRFEEICRDLPGNEDRIMREVALMAEKADIAEEITRLYSHFSQMKTLLKDGEKAVGRTMEFLLQEMHREINTMGSKSADIDISRHVVEMKGALEKIREQVQNIE